MPTPTYTPLANITLSVAASSVVFSSIPAFYRDLVLVAAAAGSTTLQGRLRLNADSGTNYSYVGFSGSGTTATSSTNTGQTSARISDVAQATTTNSLQIKIDILDYSRTDKNKYILNKAGQGTNGVDGLSNVWASTVAVNSVTVLTTTGNWAIGSTFALYGIAG